MQMQMTTWFSLRQWFHWQKLMAIVLIFFILIFLSMEAYWAMQTSLNSVEFIILFFLHFTHSQTKVKN